jgi:urease accessory protein
VIDAARVGRDGALQLSFERRGPATVLAGCRYTLPLQVLAPLALDDAAAVVSMLNPTGGMLGGDRLTIEAQLGPGAHACLTTPSANRVYRAAAGPATQRVRLTLAAGAVAEWVPDHTIPSAGAALRQSLEAHVAPGATLIAVDAFAAGRVARGEAWRFALLDSALTVRDPGGLVVHDRFVLRGGQAWDGLGGAEGRPYFATVVVVTDARLDDLLAELPGALGGLAGVTAAAARLPRRGALIRCLAAGAPALATALERIWALSRHCLLGRPPLALRKL